MGDFYANYCFYVELEERDRERPNEAMQQAQAFLNRLYAVMKNNNMPKFNVEHETFDGTTWVDLIVNCDDAEHRWVFNFTEGPSFYECSVPPAYEGTQQFETIEKCEKHMLLVLPSDVKALTLKLNRLFL